MVRSAIFAIAIWSLLLTSLLIQAADDEFPYVARVIGARAALRSGPGRQHYVCNYLARGTTVEVFHRHGTEWLAVKPTDECFSWVRSDQIELSEEEGLGEVAVQSAVSWIGSGQRRDSELHWQVRLDSGEPVEVLGEEEFSPVPGAAVRKHFMIRPPSGEFRWIRSTDVEADPQWTLIEPDSGSNDEANVDLVNYQVRLDGDQPKEKSPRTYTPNRATSDRDSPKSAEQDLSLAGHFVTPKKGLSQDELEAKPSSRWKASSAARKSYDQATLEDLNVALSEIVVQEANRSDLEALHVAAQRLVSYAANSLERAKAKRFLERVKEFEELDRRRQKLEASHKSKAKTSGAEREDEPSFQSRGKSSFASQRRSNERSTLAERVSEENDHKSAENDRKDPLDDTRYDARGRLSVFYSGSRPQSNSANDTSAWPTNWFSRGRRTVAGSTPPPYVLVDSDVNILQYVAPSPGLNLDRYKGKEVGIIGSTRYDPTLRVSVIVAERVVELDRHRK